MLFTSISLYCQFLYQTTQQNVTITCLWSDLPQDKKNIKLITKKSNILLRLHMVLNFVTLSENVKKKHVINKNHIGTLLPLLPLSKNVICSQKSYISSVSNWGLEHLLHSVVEPLTNMVKHNLRHSSFSLYKTIIGKSMSLEWDCHCILLHYIL